MPPVREMARDNSPHQNNADQEQAEFSTTVKYKDPKRGFVCFELHPLAPRLRRLMTADGLVCADIREAPT